MNRSGMNRPEPWMLTSKYRPGQREGHYESFYQRGNHPERPLAFWIRYTIFSPKGRPEQAIGELWAIYFDGETGEHVVAKEEHPIAAADFARDHFRARVADSVLEPGRLAGRAHGPAQTIAWDLRYDGGAEPMLLLKRAAYDSSFPPAKSLVAVPLAVYRGTLEVQGRTVDVDGWVGSQNHNWGSRHTDAYAFGQVAGFDNAPESFLEVVTARMRVGPVRMPQVTGLALRHQGRTHEVVGPVRGARVAAEYGYFYWRFSASTDEIRIDGEFEAAPEDFVALNYYNPPGGTKQCLNTKIARCRVTLTDLRTGNVEELGTAHRGLFEILTDHRGHGIGVRA
jgi:hypothetical protein